MAKTLLSLVLPAITALALLVTPDSVVAAPPGGHGGGGFHGGGVHAGGFHGGAVHSGFYGGGVYGGGFHNYGSYYPHNYGYHNYGFRGYGLGYSPFIYSYPFYNYGLGYYPYYGSYSYYPNYSTYGYYPSSGYSTYTPLYSYYPSTVPADSGTVIQPMTPPDNTTANVSTPSDANNSTAQVTVHVPSGASLWLNGTMMNATGSDRVFVTPTLESGRKYTYEVRAQWTDNGTNMDQTRKVMFSAGDKVDVRFPMITRP